jgi:hypothetical protein
MIECTNDIYALHIESIVTLLGQGSYLDVLLEDVGITFMSPTLFQRQISSKPMLEIMKYVTLNNTFELIKQIIQLTE